MYAKPKVSDQVIIYLISSITDDYFILTKYFLVTNTTLTWNKITLIP